MSSPRVDGDARGLLAWDSMALIQWTVDFADDVASCEVWSPAHLHARCERLLQLMGMEPFDREDAFSSQDQRIVETVQTASPEQDGLIAGTISRGYRFRGRIVRPQLVVIYRFRNVEDEL